LDQAIFRTLRSFGFTKGEIEVYIFLAKTGLVKAEDVASRFEFPKQKVYSYLKELHRHKAVYAIRSRPAKYYALPFEQMIDLYANSRIDEAQTIQKNKEKLLKQWQTMIKSKKSAN
jgi:sugar-specific transcriptional regulator TrmB